MTGYTSALGAQILIELEGEKDAAILEIQTEGAVQVADAEAAALTAVTTVLDPTSFGPGVGITTTTTGGGSFTDTVILPSKVPAGALLNNLSIVIETSGAGAWNLLYVTRNSDGTFNVVDTLDNYVIGSTGTVAVPLLKSAAGYIAPADGFVAFRRSLSTAATFRYRTGSTGSSYTKTGLLAGSNQTVSAQTYLIAYSLNVSIQRTGPDGFDATSANKSAVGYDPALPVPFTHGLYELATGSTLSLTSSAYFPFDPMPRSGFLTEISIPGITVAGTFAVHIAKMVSGQLQTVRTIFLTAAGTGTQTFTAGTHFPADIFVEAGWYRGITPQGGTITVGTSNTGASYQIAHPVVTGVGYTPTLLTAAISLQFKVNSVKMPLATMDRTMGDRLRGSTTLSFERFVGTSTPANWTLGGWTVNNGLVSPASGSTSVLARLATVGHADRMTWEFRFTITASTAIKFGIGGNEANNQYIRFNTTNNSVEICTWGGTGTTPVVKAAKVTGFASAIGTVARDYTMAVKREVNRVTVTLTDTLTAEKMVWSVKSKNNNRIMGNVGFLFESGSGSAGDVTVNWAHYSMDVSSTPHAVFFGDSGFDAWALPDSDFPSMPARIEAVRNKGDTINVSRFGFNTGNLLTEANLFLSAITSLKYGFILCGANDTVQGTLDTNYTAIVAAIVAKGGIPVMVTLTPYAARAAQIAQTNTNIRTGVYGKYPYVDLMRAVSLGNNLVDWNPAYVIADNIHLNGAGFAVAISSDANGMPTGTFASEAPFLFDGSLAGRGSMTE